MLSFIRHIVQVYIQIGFIWRRSIARIRFNHVGEGVLFYPHAIVYSGKDVRVGARTVINDFVHIWGAGGVEIGDDVLVASGCTITSQSHNVNALAYGCLYRETNANSKVTIENNVWLGSQVIVLPGVTIGTGSVIGAGSVVTRSIPPGVLALGTPAIVVRSLLGEKSVK